MKKIIKNNIYMLKKTYEISPLYLIVNIINSILYSILPVLNLLMLKFVVDEIVSGSHNINNILLYIFSFGIYSIIITNLNAYLLNYFNPKVLNHIQEKMQKEILEKVSKIDLCSIENPEFYDKYLKATSEIDRLASDVVNSIIETFSGLVVIISIVTVISTLDPIFIIFSLITVAPSLHFTKKVNKAVFDRRMSNTNCNRKMEYIKRIYYLPKFSKEIRIFSLNELFFKKYEDASNDRYKNISKYGNKISKLSMFNNTMRLSTTICMLLYLSNQIVKGYLSAGDFMALINAVSNLTMYITQLFKAIPNFHNNSMYIENLMDLFNYKPNIEGMGCKSSKILTNLEFRNVNFSYNKSDKFRLNNININFKNGSKTAIVGLNGAGKTTLIKLVLKLYQTDSGDITFGNINYNDWETDKLRKKIAIVFQDFENYAVTIAENILLRPIKSVDDVKIVWDALKSANLDEKVRKLPNTIYTNVTKEFDENGIIFSGGELQKLAIARAAVSDAEIIIMDEPSSALDPISERNMFESMINICKNKTVIFVTHRLSTISYADYIYYIENGEIVEHGTHKVLMNKKGNYFDMYITQAKNYIN